MKTTSFFIALVIAAVLAVFAIFYFVHPVLILTLKDVVILILFDVVFAFLLALYLSNDKNKNSLLMWTIIGVIFLPISIIASVFKYKKSETKE